MNDDETTQAEPTGPLLTGQGDSYTPMAFSFTVTGTAPAWAIPLLVKQLLAASPVGGDIMVTAGAPE